jgi:hypothetical protein
MRQKGKGTNMRGIKKVVGFVVVVSMLIGMGKEWVYSNNNEGVGEERIEEKGIEKEILEEKEEREKEGEGKREIDEILGERLVIGSDYGKVTKVREKGGGKVVVEIQDLHSHEGVQRNIEKILEELERKYEVKGIMVEGGYGRVDVGWIGRIKNKRYRDRVVEELVREGKLSGVEYYAIKKGKGKKLYGLEEEEKHKENIKRLGYIIGNQERYKEVLGRIGKQIKYMVDKKKNKGSRRISEEVKEYRDKKVKAEEFYKMLEKHIEEINRNPGRNKNILGIKKQEYENISKYEEMVGEELRIKDKGVKKELEEWIEELKGKMPYYGYKKLMERTDRFQKMMKLSMYIREISERYGIDIRKKYKNLERYVKRNEIEMSINPIEMVKEERGLIEKIMGAKEESQEEREIGYIEDMYGYLCEYLGNKLMAMDYEYYKDNEERFKKMYRKYAVIDELEAIEKDLEILGEYYRVNNERNEIFVKKIKGLMGEGENEEEVSEGEIWERREKVEGEKGGKEKRGRRIENKEVEECIGRGREIVIVVTGGYHSEGMGEILEREGISEIVITPNVLGGVGRAEKIYEGIIEEEVKVLKEALSYTVISQMEEIEMERYLVRAGIELIKRSGYSQELMRQMVVAANEVFGEGRVEIIRINDEVGEIRFSNGEMVRIEVGEKGQIEIKGEGKMLDESVIIEEEEDEDGEEDEERGIEIGKYIGKIKEEVVSGKIIDVKEQVKNFYRMAYDKGISGVLSTDGMMYELDEYVRREGVKEVGGVSIEVISKMPKGVQEYLFAREVLGREIRIENLGEGVRAVVTAIVELGDILRASEREEYFEEFLRRHGEENEVRRAGLVGITTAIKEALNQTGLSLAGKLARAIEIGINKHVEHNIAHPEARLELPQNVLDVLDKLKKGEDINDEETAIVLHEISKGELTWNDEVLNFFERIKNNKNAYDVVCRSFLNNPDLFKMLTSDQLEKIFKTEDFVYLVVNVFLTVSGREDGLIKYRKKMLKNPPLINGSYAEKKQYITNLLAIEEAIAREVNNWTAPNNTLSLSESLSKEEQEYFKIMKMSIDNDITNLQNRVDKDEDKDKDKNIIKYRLYAFMQLQMAGVEVDEQVRKNLIADTREAIQNKAFTIGSVDSGTSVFDLRALTTGISLILTNDLSKTIDDGDSFKNLISNTGIYERISKAIFVKQEGVVLGNSSLIFSEIFLSSDNINTLYDCIAHELGHNYFNLMGLDFSRNSNTNDAFHEFIAITMQGLFSQKITDGRITKVFRNMFSFSTLSKWIIGILAVATIVLAIAMMVTSVSMIFIIISSVVLMLMMVYLMVYKNLFSFSTLSKWIIGILAVVTIIAAILVAIFSSGVIACAITLVGIVVWFGILIVKYMFVENIFSFSMLTRWIISGITTAIILVPFVLCFTSIMWAIIISAILISLVILGLVFLMPILFYSIGDLNPHYHALSLLRDIEKEYKKPINFFVVMWLALRFFKTNKDDLNSSNKNDVESMKRKFIDFMRQNLEKVIGEINSKLGGLDNDDPLRNSNMEDIVDIRSTQSPNKRRTPNRDHHATDKSPLLVNDSSGVRNRKEKKLELPLLTKAYNFLGIREEKRAKITAVIETPFIILASIFRGFGNVFLRWHGKDEGGKRAEGLEGIRKAVRAAWEETYSRIPGVNLCLRIYNAIRVNYIKHVEWNLRQGDRKKEVVVEEGKGVVMIDYHEVGKGELEEVVEEFGEGVRGVGGEEGIISMPVYVIREKLEEGEGEIYGFENSGISIDGNMMWVGEYKGAVVVYAQGVEVGEISREISNNSKVEGQIKEKVEGSVKGVKLKGIEIEGIEVVKEEGEEEGVSYSEEGEIRVGYRTLKEKVERGEVVEFSGTLREIKKAEGYTYAKSIVHELNDVEEVEGFKEYLEQHQKIGNGQIVVKEGLVKKMMGEIEKSKVGEFLREARKDGVEVYVKVEGEGEVKEYERMGFAGYVEGRELVSFEMGSRVEIEEIGGFRNERELEEKLREAKGMVMIENSELKRVIEGSRTGLSIGDLIGILSSIKKVISIFSGRAISKEEVEGVVRNIGIEEMPEVSQEGLERIREMVRDKELMDIENLKKALSITGRGSDVVSVYIGKVERQVEGREDREEIMKVLVSSIIEKVLVVEELRREGKDLGLRDKSQEEVLGRALVKRMEKGIEGEGKKGYVEEFVKGIKTQKEAEEKLNSELVGLKARMEEGEVEAVEKIIELIPEISEGRRKVEVREDVRPRMDTKAYRSILTAA